MKMGPPKLGVRVALVLLLALETVHGSLFVKYETEVGSPISIPIETSPPTRLLGAPAWLSISDQDKEPNTDKHTPVVLLLKGTATEVGSWTFSIADQVGMVSIQIEAVESKEIKEPSASAVKPVQNQIVSTDRHHEVPALITNEILQPSLDQSPSLITKAKRRRRAMLEGSGGHHIGEGIDDEDYNEEDDEDEEDYEDEDDDLLEERRVPIEPTPTLHRPPVSFEVDEPLSSSTTSTPVPIRVELTPTAVSHTLPPASSPILVRPDYIEYGSGMEPETKTRIVEQPSTTTPPSTPSFQKTHRNLEKLAIYHGKLFTYKIPDDIFTPVDTKIRYSIEPQPSGGQAYESWIWVHDDNWIYALPRDRDISDYNLTLVAERVDSGERAHAQLYVSIRQRGKWRMYNHEIEVEWGRNTLLDQGITPGSATPVEEGVKLIRQAVGGSWDDDDVIVRKLEMHGIKYKLFYTNETLLVGHSQNTCPVSELNGIAQRLRRTFDHVSVHLTDALCEGMRPAPPRQDPQQPVIPPTQNYPPDIRNRIGSIPGVKGEFLVYNVKHDFCYDPEDGDTRQLKISLKDDRMEPVSDTNWLQLDEKNQEIYGLPGFSGEYTVVCTDSGGKPANDPIVVNIREQPIKEEDNYLTMNLHFEAAEFKPPTIRKFVEKLALAFNDSDTSNIIVLKYQESISGNRTSVHFTWVNRTNPSDEYEISELRRVMLSNDGPPKLEFAEFFKPEFVIKVGELMPSRIMIGGGTVNEDVKVTHAGAGGEDDGFIKYEWMDSSQYLITFVIPGILIFIMILLAVLIACLLSRQSSKTVTNPKSTRLIATNNAMLKKGVPVIFQDEYFDETERHPLNESSSRSPAILRDEHPPLPPEYRRHGPGSGHGSQGRNVPPARSNMNIQGYQPPPGFNQGHPPGHGHGHRPVPNTRPPPHLGGGGFGGRGRNPPPYVPP